MRFFKEFKLDEEKKQNLIAAVSYQEQESAFLEIIKDIVTPYTCYGKEDITLSDSFKNDLSVDSLEFVEIGDIIERNFNFSFSVFPLEYNMTISEYIKLTLAELAEKEVVKRTA